MYRSKVIKVYNSLSQNDKRSLNKFIQSPIHNLHKDVNALFDYIYRLKIITPEKVDRKVVHAKIFPKRKYSEVDIRHVSSYMFQTIEDFINYRAMKQSEMAKFVSLTSYYSQHALGKLLDSTYKKFEKREKIIKKDASFYHDKYLILDDLMQSSDQKNRTGDKGFQQVVDTLDIYYIAEKLKQSSTLLSHQAISDQDYELTFIDGILQFVEQKGLLEIPAIAIYYHNFFMVKEPDKFSHFDKYEKVLVRNTEAFEEKELKDLYLLAINFCIKKMNEGQRQYLKKGFQLYQVGLDNKALIPYGILSRYTYRNIITVALLLNENKWALDFIHDYKDYLDPRYMEDTYQFNLAFYYYRIRDFKKSLQILAILDFDDEITMTRAKSLQLKMYYEGKDIDILESFLDSFWVYLKRKKGLGYHADNCFKLIRYTKAMLHTSPGDDKRLNKLKSKIESEPSFSEKKWLLEKVEKLL